MSFPFSLDHVYPTVESGLLSFRLREREGRDASRYTRLCAERKPIPRDVKATSVAHAVLVGLRPEFLDTKSLKPRIGGAILNPLSVRIALTQPSCRRVIRPCMKSSSPELALRSLPAIEAIGSDSDFVATSDVRLCARSSARA